MIIKSFTAESATAAMKMVRKEMGGEAIVLKTRQVVDRHNRPRVEITACLEKATVGAADQILGQDRVGGRVARRFEPPVISSDPDSRIADALDDEPGVLEPKPAPAPAEEARSEEPTPQEPTEDLSDEPTEEVPENNSEERVEPNEPAAPITPSNDRLAGIEARLDRLVRLTMQRGAEQIPDATIRAIVASLRDADLPEDFIDQLILSRLDRLSGDTAAEAVRGELVKALSKLTVPDLRIKPGEQVLFVGPPGVGKSSVMGKLATQLVTIDKRKVRLAGFDFQKVGAHEELAGYADLLNLDVAEVARTRREKKAAKDVVTLIDAPAMPIDPEKRKNYLKAVRELDAKHRFLVISALMRSDDMKDLAQLYADLAPTNLIATMLDLTRRHGSLVAAARTLDTRLAFVSDSGGGIGRLGTPDPASLAANLTGLEVFSE